MVLGYNRLSLDGKRLMVRFTHLGSKVYDSCLVSFKGRSASPFPVKSSINNCFNSFLIALRGGSSYPCGEIIHKSDCSSLAVDLLLHEVCVEEEE